MTARRRYGLFGHSAGGQFVHRMLSFGYREHVAVAVSANAGTYAMPDLGIAWPFGLGETDLDADALRALLRFRITVMTGTQDIKTTGRFFPKGPRSMRQGGTRHERAHNYVAAGRAAATALGHTLHMDGHRCARCWHTMASTCRSRRHRSLRLRCMRRRTAECGARHCYRRGLPVPRHWPRHVSLGPSRTRFEVHSVIRSGNARSALHHRFRDARAWVCWCSTRCTAWTTHYRPQPQMVAGHVVSDGGRLWELTLRDGLALP